MKQVAVVGAGAAGITAALRAAEAGAKVTLLNAHPKIGLKILMSGGTRCNVTHRVVTENDYNGGSRNVVRRILRAFTPEQTRFWFDDMGVKLKLEETGKYFPETDDAQTVLDALLRAVHRAGVVVETGARVVRLERGGPAFVLGVQAVRESAALGTGAVSAYGAIDFPLPSALPERSVYADAVVLAAGGLSFPRTGSDGTGHALAQSLGHHIEPTIPALTPLTASDAWCRELQGLTVEAELSLVVRGRAVVQCAGSFLFTHFGYSGPAALDFSRHWLSADADAKSREVRVSFYPGLRVDQVLAAWDAIAVAEPKATVRRIACRVLPESLVDLVLNGIEFNGTKYMSQTPRADREAVAAAFTSSLLKVDGTLGYEKAEVTAGGVRLSEVEPSTLESRVMPGVFLCGEMLDVEGRLGGFNFQWSWSSGTVAGRAAASG